MKKKWFSIKEKDEHYNKLAKSNNKALTKDSAKFTAEEQISFAKGWKAKSDESKRIFAYNHSTEAQREDYKAKKEYERQQYLASKSK